MRSHTKGSDKNTRVSCPNVIKMYNASMGGANVIDQKTAAYRLSRNRKFRFYLRMLFDLINFAIVNSQSIRGLVVQFSCLISKVLLRNCLLEDIALGNNLFL